jgi:dTDP-4-dehydrorhamnose reductase
MRILLTGVSGQVGGALALRLGNGATVIAAGREMLDLARPAEIPSRLDAIAADLIINSAAYTAVDQAEDERDLAFTVNAEAPGALARWAGARGVPLMHFSTDYVFDGSGERPWREDDTPHPLSTYGASKLAGEEEVRAAGGPHLVVRTSWVYAATGKNFLRTVARLAAERAELRVVADQIGAPTSAALIAETVALMLDGSQTAIAARFAAAGGLVHLAACGATSWHGFACAIVQGLKARGGTIKTRHVATIRTEDYPTRAVRPKNSRLDVGRLGSVFGIVPMSWSEALIPELDQLAALI